MPVQMIQELVGYSVPLLAMIAPSTGSSIFAEPQTADMVVIDGGASGVRPLTDVVIIFISGEVVGDTGLNQPVTQKKTLIC